MFEPLTQTIGQLALRWNCSVRDVLTHAVQRNWPLYFYFDGLVIDVNDRANRFGGCQRQEDEADWLEKAIERAEETLARNALHAQGKLELSRFEQVLDQNASIALRATTEENKRLLKVLRASIETWHEGRRRFHRNGAVRATPATLQGISDTGAVSFPIKAYHPESPTWVAPNPDGPGQLLEGRLVALEYMGPQPKEKLTADDIFANMTDIKAIDAWNGAASVPQTDSAPAPAVTVATAGAGETASWLVKKPQRWQGYNKPLFEFLERAHAAGSAIPKAMDVLDAFRLSQPHEIIEIMADGLKYYDSKGNGKPADLRAIGKAIGRIAQLAAADSADSDV